MQSARDAGATADELAEIATEAIRVRDDATRAAEARALDLPAPEPRNGPVPNWLVALTGIGAAYAVSCPSTLATRLAVGREVGVKTDDVRAVVKLADFIRDKATSYVSDLVPR